MIINLGNEYSTVKIDLTKLSQYIRSLTKGDGQKLIIEAMIFRYKEYAFRRFLQLSGGGGEWPPLAASTIRKKRGDSRILIAAGNLRDSLIPVRNKKNTGTVAYPTNEGVRFGFSDETHPGSGKSFRELATIHTKGRGYNPKRVVIDEPDQKTLDTIEQDVLKIAFDIKRKLGMT